MREACNRFEFRPFLESHSFQGGTVTETARVSESVGHPRCFSPEVASRTEPVRNSHPKPSTRNSRQLSGSRHRRTRSGFLRRQESFGSFSGVFRLRHDERYAPRERPHRPAKKQRPQPESCGRKKHSPANGINRNSAKRCPDVPSCTRSEATCRTSCRTSPP